MNADSRLSLDPLGPVEGGDGIVEGSPLADVCSCQSNDSRIRQRRDWWLKGCKSSGRNACIVR